MNPLIEKLDREKRRLCGLYCKECELDKEHEIKFCEAERLRIPYTLDTYSSSLIQAIEEATSKLDYGKTADGYEYINRKSIINILNSFKPKR